MKYRFTIVYFILFVLSLTLNIYQCHTDNEQMYADTIRTTVIDTIRFVQPIPKDSSHIGDVVAKLPVSKDDKEDNFLNKSVAKMPENVQKFPESGKNLQDSVANFGKPVPDSAKVQIPITQKVYSDSTYTAYVSGFNPSLDSITLNLPKETILIKNIKPKRWSIGVNVGYGIMLNGTPKLSPYIGVGISYNLWSF